MSPGLPLPEQLPTAGSLQLARLPGVQGDLVAVVQRHPSRWCPAVCWWSSTYGHLPRPVRMMLNKPGCIESFNKGHVDCKEIMQRFTIEILGSLGPAPLHNLCLSADICWITIGDAVLHGKTIIHERGPRNLLIRGNCSFLTEIKEV